MPGSLPVLNKKVVDYALRVGLAANCKINQLCKFDRKNYFYPDNPQNYQISQLYLPICHDGYVEIDTAAGKKKIGIHEIHMEEDAGKLIHDEWEDCSLVDYNRSGVPLIEIVSEPDMRSAEEVIAYLEKLRMMIQYLGASDCKLQEGSMRADVNLSVREVAVILRILFRTHRIGILFVVVPAAGFLDNGFSFLDQLDLPCTLSLDRSTISLRRRRRSAANRKKWQTG